MSMHDEWDDVNDFLESGGIPSAGFDTIGASWTGTIVRMEKLQSRDFETGEAQTWDDGAPKYMIHVDIQTQVRNPDIAGDDGVRRLFVRGNMMSALRGAMRATGSRLLPGGTLTVSYVRDGDQKKRGFNPAKLYEAKYEPPVAGLASIGVDDLA
jgi:hypothetical protein